MQNYYFTSINTISNYAIPILFGEGHSVSWDTRLKFCEKYYKKLITYYIIKAQLNFINKKIDEDKLSQYYKHYYSILNVINKYGLVNYFLIDEKLYLSREVNRHYLLFKEGKITEEFLKNRVANLTIKKEHFGNICADETSSLRFAVTKAEEKIVEAINTKNIQLSLLDKYISDQTCSSTFKDVEYTISNIKTNNKEKVYQ